MQFVSFEQALSYLRSDMLTSKDMFDLFVYIWALKDTGFTQDQEHAEILERYYLERYKPEHCVVESYISPRDVTEYIWPLAKNKSITSFHFQNRFEHDDYELDIIFGEKMINIVFKGKVIRSFRPTFPHAEFLSEYIDNNMVLALYEWALDTKMLPFMF